MQLADVFENFRNNCNSIHKLDPANYLSVPGLAWQACLKNTGIRLGLLTDFVMFLLIESGLR